MKLLPFFLAFYQYSRREVIVIGLLNFLTAATEGVGLMMLIPLLALAGLGEQTAGLPAWLGSSLSSLSEYAPNQKLLMVLAAFIALIGFQAVVSLTQQRRSQNLMLRYVDHLRVDMFLTVAATRWNYLAQRHSAAFLSVLNNDIERVGGAVQHLAQLLASMLMTLSYVMVALQLSQPLTLLTLAIGGLLWASLRHSRQLSRKSGELLSSSYERMYLQLQEFMSAIKLIKIHAEEKSSVRQYDAALGEVRSQFRDFTATQTWISLVYRIGAALSLALIAYLAITYSGLAPAGLLVLIAIFSRMVPQLSQIQVGVAELNNMLPAFENYQQQRNLCRLHQEATIENKDAAPSLGLAIELKDLRYRHPGAHHELQVTHLVIPAHATTAIVGPSGSGKTTLLDVIAGLNFPDQGAVLADGLPIAAAHREWRGRLAYIPQESVILDGTIRENLAWGNGNLTDQDIGRALEQAAAGFVHALPRGLETLVGERGVRLSGGERQRLALARALLRHPQLLILDEATNALDEANQLAIMEAIRKLHGQITILIVTHRYQEFSDLLDGRVDVISGVVSEWRATGNRGSH